MSDGLKSELLIASQWVNVWDVKPYTLTHWLAIKSSDFNPFYYDVITLLIVRFINVTQVQ